MPSIAHRLIFGGIEHYASYCIRCRLATSFVYGGTSASAVEGHDGSWVDVCCPAVARSGY